YCNIFYFYEMKNEIPFTELNAYLEKGIEDDLVYFINGFQNEDLGTRVKDFNKNTLTFEVLKDLYGEGESDTCYFTFENQIKYKLLDIQQHSLEIAKTNFVAQKRFSINKANLIIENHLNQIESIFSSEKLNTFPFLEKYKVSLKEQIGNLKSILNNIETNKIPPLILLPENPDETLDKITRLYNLLVEEPPLISCTLETFIKA